MQSHICLYDSMCRIYYKFSKHERRLPNDRREILQCTHRLQETGLDWIAIVINSAAIAMKTMNTATATTSIHRSIVLGFIRINTVVRCYSMRLSRRKCYCYSRRRVCSRLVVPVRVEYGLGCEFSYFRCELFCRVSVSPFSQRNARNSAL